MINPDDLNAVAKIDVANVRAAISAMPSDAAPAYQRGLVAKFADQPKRIVCIGQGDPATAANIVQALLASSSSIPIEVVRGYDLPAYASGASVTVIAISYSGNTEETLSAFAQGIQRGCQCVALTTGGKLATLGAQVIALPTRESVIAMCMTLLGVCVAMGAVADLSAEVNEAVSVMQLAEQKIGTDSPAMRNPSKRLAGQFVDRLPVIYGAGITAPIARFYKTQLHAYAHMLASHDALPDVTHNSIVGYTHAEEVWRRAIVIMLRSSHEHARIARRFELTTTMLLESGINQDSVRAQGHSALAQQTSLIYFAYWTAFHTAMMKGENPADETAVRKMKEAMAAS